MKFLAVPQHHVYLHLGHLVHLQAKRWAEEAERGEGLEKAHLLLYTPPATIHLKDLHGYFLQHERKKSHCRSHQLSLQCPGPFAETQGRVAGLGEPVHVPGSPGWTQGL